MAAPSFLGHGETAPDIQVVPAITPVKCDLGGDSVFDEIYSGESGTVSVDLIRYNMPLLQAIQSRARSTSFPAAVGGVDGPGQVGTLMLAEGAAFQLYLRFPNVAKAVFSGPVGVNSGGPMPAGYRFFAARLDPDSMKGGSAQPLKAHLSFKCMRAFSPVVGPFGFGSFSLFDNNISAISTGGLN